MFPLFCGYFVSIGCILQGPVGKNVVAIDLLREAPIPLPPSMSQIRIVSAASSLQYLRQRCRPWNINQHPQNVIGKPVAAVTDATSIISLQAIVKKKSTILILSASGTCHNDGSNQTHFYI